MEYIKRVFNIILLLFKILLKTMAIQIAYYWILGWLAAKENISDEDRNIIEQGVKNYYFI